MSDLWFTGIAMGFVLGVLVDRTLLVWVAGYLSQHGWR